MNQNPIVNAQSERMQVQRKKDSGRAALLLIVFASVLNLITLVTTQTYYVFSSFVTQFLALLGAQLYFETQAVVWPIAFGILGLLSVLPYVLCYIFSKKKAGWLTGALVLFGVDTLLLLAFFAWSGDLTMIIDLAVHVWAIVSLVGGVKASKKLAEMPEEEVVTAQDLFGEGGELYGTPRSITVGRAKSWVGSAMPVTVCINGVALETLKNGESKSITISDRACTLTVTSTQMQVSNPIEIPEGLDPKIFALTFKSRPMAGYIELILEEK